MRKNLSKVKNKLSKGTEQRKEEVNGVAGSSRDTGRIGQGKEFCVYNVNANQTKQIRERAPPDRSSTAYDTFTSSTSESDPDRLFHVDRKYKDPEVCITVPEEGKGRAGVRIVANASRTKQVEFASLDAVYGTPTTSVVSSDDDDERINELCSFGKERIRVYRAEGRQQNAFTRNRESIRDDGVVQEDETNKATPKNSRMQPALTTPLISVNIETSQEELNRENSGKDNTSPNTSSRLTRMKQQLLEKKDGGPEVNGHKDEGNKVQKKVGNVGSKSVNQVYYVESEGRDVSQIQGALKQLLSMSNQGQFNNGLTQPMTYVATVNGNDILSLQRIESSGQNKAKVTKISPKSSPKNVVVKKSSSRQSTRNKIEVRSKIVLKRSKMSILKSSIPKPSSKIIRRSSLTVNKNSGSVNKDGSSKYVVRDVVVIPEETGKQFPDIHMTKASKSDIREETIMLTEREIQSHIFEDSPAKPTSVSASKKADSIQIQQFLPNRKSLENYNEIQNTPCLYSTSSANDARSANKSDKAYQAKPEVEDEHDVTSDTSLGTTAKRRHTGGKRNKPTVQDKPNTIVIDDETHKEIMEAIDATGGKECIISLPTKISRRDTNSNQLSIKAKRSNNELSIVRGITDEVTPREDKENVKRVSFKKSSLGKRERKANVEDDRKLSNVTRKQLSGPQGPDASIVNPFTGKANTGNTGIMAYPMQVNPYDKSPMYYDSFDNDSQILSWTEKRKTSFTKAKTTPNPVKKEESTVVKTILSFSEPVIKDGSQNSIPLGGGKKTSKLRRSYSKTSKQYADLKIQTPENMVYVGRLPNTTYNVFFSPDAASQPAKTKRIKKTKSNTNKLSPIKSDKLLAQGPKAILIFVNKKTELNRNPFDGNVIYDEEGSDYYMQKGKGRGKKLKDRDGRDKYGKGRKQPKGGKYGRPNGGRDFDVASWRDPRSDGVSGRSDDRTIVERSPSGMKTVIKYHCGCMKITKMDPETGSVTEETTSAFCTLGSRCEIGQSQRDKRVIRYDGGSMDYGEPSFDRTTTYGGGVSGRGGPGGRGSPQLDIVLEGIVSKKPIPERQPAPTMKGANLTGTLTIKTNRCNGVFNFYLDPRIKRCLASKLACLTDGNNYSTAATVGPDSYSRRTSYSRQ